MFGPVVAINTFSDEEDALQKANDTEFGLFASVYTKDISRAIRVAKGLEAGGVSVNCSSTTNSIGTLPFGGWKQSGEGRVGGKHGIDGWLEVS